MYLTSCVPYVPDPENTTLLKTALEIFRKFDKYPQALRLALQLNDPKLILEIFQDCKEPIMQKQLAFMLFASFKYPISLRPFGLNIITILHTASFTLPVERVVLVIIIVSH